MFGVIVALLAAEPAPPADLGRTALVFATVGHSEWCPAGNVQLDLLSGEYRFTPRAPRRVCQETGLERPVQGGTVDAARLALLRSAYRRALGEGLKHRACIDGGEPEQIVVSNGGTPTLVLTTGARTRSAPDDLTCWSNAARDLHDALDDAFPSSEQR